MTAPFEPRSPLRVELAGVPHTDEQSIRYQLPPERYRGRVSRGDYELLQVEAESEQSVALILAHFVGAQRS